MKTVKERDCPNDAEALLYNLSSSEVVIKQARLLEDTSKKDSSNLDRSNYKLLQPGDIAYNKPLGRCGRDGRRDGRSRVRPGEASDHRGIISPAYDVQRGPVKAAV